MRDEKPLRFPVRIEIRAPLVLSSALERAADRAMTSVSEYSRRAIVERLRKDGIPIELNNQQRASEL
jgi:hypothetical protein